MRGPWWHTFVFLIVGVIAVEAAVATSAAAEENKHPKAAPRRAVQAPVRRPVGMLKPGALKPGMARPGFQRPGLQGPGVVGRTTVPSSAASRFRQGIGTGTANPAALGLRNPSAPFGNGRGLGALGARNPSAPLGNGRAVGALGARNPSASIANGRNRPLGGRPANALADRRNTGALGARSRGPANAAVNDRNGRSFGARGLRPGSARFAQTRTPGLVSRLRGGNGAPPGTRLIDMRVMPLPPGTGLPPVGETRFLSREVVLQFSPNVTPQQVTAAAQRLGLTVESQHTIGALKRTVYTFRINNGRPVADVIRQVQGAGLNAAAQPNYTYGLTQDQKSADGNLGDPAQYIVEKLQLAAVHRITEGNDVVVALIDSRVDPKQPDLAGRVIDYYDAGCGPDAPADAHGTGMAGAIASHVGLLGIAPNAKIIAICAFGGSGGSPESTSSKIIRGLDYAIEHGAKIINMSFAGPQDPALAQELQVAREKGILIVAAAGNAGPKSPPLYPGADPNVMAVTATDQQDRLFKGANQGDYITVAAPGVNILVPAPNGDVQFTTGTSVATANVTGVAALLLAEKPSRTPEDIRALLVDTARHLGTEGLNPQFGAGLVDPLKALQSPPEVVGQEQPSARAASEPEPQ